jgi:hypothetical protein
MRSTPCLAPTRDSAAMAPPSGSLASGGVLRRLLGGRLAREGDIQRVASGVVREDDPLEQPLRTDRRGRGGRTAVGRLYERPP